MLSARGYWNNQYTQFPNDVLGWIVHEAKTKNEAKVVSLIARLSCGFHRRRTHRRLNLDFFASELNCDRSTISRVITSLLKQKRIFRFDPQGNYFYYSLYPNPAKQEDNNATLRGLNATLPAKVTMPRLSAVVAMQRNAGQSEHISSIIQRVTRDGQTRNIPMDEDSIKKGIE